MENDTDNPEARRRWFRLTPDRCVFALLMLDVLLPLSDRLGWFPFNQHKGWTVLINLAIVGLAGAMMLLLFAAALLLRWRFRFTIRSLFAMMAVVTVPLSWFAMAKHQAEAQRQAVNVIRELCPGSRLGYYYYHTDLWSTPQLTEPEWVLEQVGPYFFADVAVVTLFGTNITDGELERLAPLSHIRILSLKDTAVTDAGLANLQGSSQLATLDLGNTRITDAGLEHAKCLSTLTELGLENTKITDAGLEHLHRLINLKGLYVYGTRVTNDGVQAIQRALPNCKIYH